MSSPKSHQVIIKTIASKSWRLNNLYVIRDKQKKRMIFKPNAIQQLLNARLIELKKRGRGRRVVILKSRQLGITTNFCVQYVDLVNFKQDQLIAVMAHRREEVSIIFQNYIRFVYDHMRVPSIKVRAQYDSKTFLSLHNMSTIAVTTDAHGLTPSILYITEAARVKNAQDKILEAMQGVPQNGMVIMESTAEKPAGFFYDICQSCLSGDSSWDFIFLPWFLTSEYALQAEKSLKYTEEEKELKTRYLLTNAQLNWRREKIKEFGGDKRDLETGLTGLQLFKRSYPNAPEEAFVSGAGAIFDAELLRNYLNNPRPILKRQQVERGEVILYEEVKERASYIIGADPAEGVGQDYSAAVILRKDRKGLVFVGIIHGFYPPSSFARVLRKYAEKFNNALLVIERNNHGHAVLVHLIEHLRYSNVYYHNEINMKGKGQAKPGYPLLAKARALILTDLQEQIEEGLYLPDEKVINELLTFYFIDGKAQALPGKHDDLVFALAYGVSVWCDQKRPEVELKRPYGM